MTVVTSLLALETEIGVGLRQYLVDDLFRHEAREDIAHALALEGRERVVRADRAHGRHQEGGGRIDVGEIRPPCSNASCVPSEKSP